MSGRELRLFVAIYPPDDARAGMCDQASRWLQETKNHAAITPNAQVHMTVQFVGATPERELDGVVESVQRSASGIGPFSLTPTRLVTLPERGPVRLLALETDAPAALLELHDRLVIRLARKPRPRKDDQFLPHLTLCRFRGDAKVDRFAQPSSLPPFPVSSVKLMRSVLTPAGAVHTVVASADL